MANIKISNLPAATDVTGDDLLPVVDGGATTQKATFQQVLDYVTGSTFNDLSVTSLTASVTGTFVGNGTGITGVTAEWDGSHVGNASITGSLFVTQELDVSSWLRGSRIVVDQFVTASLYMLAPEFRGDLIGTASAVENCLQDGDGINITDHCYNGASVGSVTVDSSVVRLSEQQTLTNKIFGSTFDAVHQFTGSVEVSGTLIADVALVTGAVGPEITSTSYSLSSADRGKTLLFSSSVTQGITCSSGLNVGYNATFIQLGSGQLELSASVGSSILNRQSHTKTAGLYAAASVVIISANTYLFAGDTSA